MKTESAFIDPHWDLIKNCLAGDRKSYREVYKLYSKAMFAIALRIVRDRDVAEDILQESFINAFSNLTNFKSESTFGAWLKKIVVNTSINYIKKKKMIFLSLDEIGINKSDEEKEEPIYNVAKIKEAIGKLPDGFRVILTLYLFEGYDHKEIAEILEISESTSKSQYSRAKDKLKKILTQ